MQYELATDFFAADDIGDREDIERGIELLQIELENFVNAYAEEDLQMAPAEVQQEVGYLLYAIGRDFYLLGDYATSAEYFETGLAFDLPTTDTYVIEMVKGYGLALLNSDQGKSGIVLEAVYDDFNNYADFCLIMGCIYIEQHQYEQAVVEFARAATLCEDAIAGSNSYLACYYAGQCREKQGRIEEARAFYAKASSYPPARERLTAL